MSTDSATRETVVRAKTLRTPGHRSPSVYRSPFRLTTEIGREQQPLADLFRRSPASEQIAEVHQLQRSFAPSHVTLRVPNDWACFKRPPYNLAVEILGPCRASSDLAGLARVDRGP
jgi:hypothetical protein